MHAPAGVDSIEVELGALEHGQATGVHAALQRDCLVDDDLVPA